MKKIIIFMFIITTISVCGFAENNFFDFKKYSIDKGKEFNEKDYKAMIAVNAGLFGLGSSFVISAVIMGFIPYHVFPEVMTRQDYSYSDWIKYPKMTVYASAGISLFLTGTLLILVCLPIMIYSIVKLNSLKEKDNENSVKVSFQNFPFEIKIYLDKI